MFLTSLRDNLFVNNYFAYLAFVYSLLFIFVEIRIDHFLFLLMMGLFYLVNDNYLLTCRCFKLFSEGSLSDFTLFFFKIDQVTGKRVQKDEL